ncbi:hypothetical protein RJT34_30036 [Clitoria ternatea]|uniref:triose-phosphate isomerase n=1 Tax=Clitoria ternatea TaxID=43366 RepID=A0AAN9I012_CLITE
MQIWKTISFENKFSARKLNPDLHALQHFHFKVSSVYVIHKHVQKIFRRWQLEMHVVVSPLFVFLPFVKSLLRFDFHVAAQTVGFAKFVGDKVAYALAQCLKVIACIGEILEQ